MCSKGPAIRLFMRSKLFAILTLFSIWITVVQSHKVNTKLANRREKIYTNGWAVKLIGGIENAVIVAQNYGFSKVEKVCWSRVKWAINNMLLWHWKSNSFFHIKPVRTIEENKAMILWIYSEFERVWNTKIKWMCCEICENKTVLHS